MYVEFWSNKYALSHALGRLQILLLFMQINQVNSFMDNYQQQRRRFGS